MWAQFVSAAIGVWFMAAPAVLNYTGAANTAHRIAGPIVATLAVIAVSACTREVRLANVPLGLVLILAPLAFDFPLDAALNSVAGGSAVAALSCVRGRVRSRFGGGWRVVWGRSVRDTGECLEQAGELRHDSNN